MSRGVANNRHPQAGWGELAGNKKDPKIYLKKRELFKFYPTVY